MCAFFAFRKSFWAGLGLSLGLLVASPVQASMELVRKNACLTCHATDKKVMGPSFREVGARYNSSSSTAEQLAASIKKGGSGKWGATPMPEQRQLSETDARSIAEWVLAGSK